MNWFQDSTIMVYLLCLHQLQFTILPFNAELSNEKVGIPVNKIPALIGMRMRLRHRLTRSHNDNIQHGRKMLYSIKNKEGVKQERYCWRVILGRRGGEGSGLQPAAAGRLQLLVLPVRNGETETQSD